MQTSKESKAKISNVHGGIKEINENMKNIGSPEFSSEESENEITNGKIPKKMEIKENNFGNPEFSSEVISYENDFIRTKKKNLQNSQFSSKENEEKEAIDYENSMKIKGEEGAKKLKLKSTIPIPTFFEQTQDFVFNSEQVSYVKKLTRFKKHIYIFDINQLAKMGRNPRNLTEHIENYNKTQEKFKNMPIVISLD